MGTGRHARLPASANQTMPRAPNFIKFLIVILRGEQSRRQRADGSEQTADQKAKPQIFSACAFPRHRPLILKVEEERSMRAAALTTANCQAP